MQEWYDGYHFQTCLSLYNPRSVVEAMLSRIFDTYWNQTETFEALKSYIDLDFDGLKDAVIAMLAGEHIYVDVRSFTNDMATFHSYEDVLTLLVHLGYHGNVLLVGINYNPKSKKHECVIEKIYL